MLKYFEAKFNDCLENIVSHQRRALSDVPTEESNDSIFPQLRKKTSQCQHPLNQQYIFHQSLITLVSTATNGRAYWLYFFVDEARANMEHNIITLELSI